MNVSIRLLSLVAMVVLPSCSCDGAIFSEVPSDAQAPNSRDVSEPTDSRPSDAQSIDSDGSTVHRDAGGTDSDGGFDPPSLIEFGDDVSVFSSAIVEPRTLAVAGSTVFVLSSIDIVPGARAGWRHTLWSLDRENLAPAEEPLFLGEGGISNEIAASVTSQAQMRAVVPISRGNGNSGTLAFDSRIDVADQSGMKLSLVRSIVLATMNPQTWSPSGPRMAVSAGDHAYVHHDSSQQLHLVDYKNAQRLDSFPIEHTPVSMNTFRTTRLATVTNGGTVRVYDIENGTPDLINFISIDLGPNRPTNHVAFIDEQTLAFVSPAIPRVVKLLAVDEQRMLISETAEVSLVAGLDTVPSFCEEPIRLEVLQPQQLLVVVCRERSTPMIPAKLFATNVEGTLTATTSLPHEPSDMAIADDPVEPVVLLAYQPNDLVQRIPLRLAQ